jgi:hypothetical protein
MQTTVLLLITVEAYTRSGLDTFGQCHFFPVLLLTTVILSSTGPALRGQASCDQVKSSFRPPRL